MLSLVAMDYFQKSPVLVFPLIALGLFMAVFFAVTLRTVLSSKSKYEAISRMPLENGSAPAEVGRE